MQIDITNIIETARADKEARANGEKRMAEIRKEIEKLQIEHDIICDRIVNGSYGLPKWQSDLLAMVGEIIEQQTDKDQ